MSNFYRITVTYKDGSVDITGRSDKREADKLADKYKALPTVKSVGVKEVGGRG